MITSMSNGQMKLVQQLIKKAKARKESGLFVVEGMKMFREAPQERIEKVYASSSFLKEAENQSVILEKGCTEKNGKLEEVDDKVFKNLSDTVTPQGILCLIKRVEIPIKEILKTKDEKAPFLMILEDLQDPGNMGTILRTAEGAGVTGIILSKNCVDLYNPKVIRSTMGSIYRIPVMQADLLEILPVLKENKIHVYLKTKFDLKSDYKSYYAIIVATGFHEKILGVPGAVLKNVKSIYDVLANKNYLDDISSVTINAKSELSLKLALFLAKNKKKVSVIVNDAEFLLNLPNDRLTYYLFILKSFHVKVYLFAKIKQVQNDFVEIVVNDKIKPENFQVDILNLKSGSSFGYEAKAKNIDIDLFIYEPEIYSNNRLYYELVNAGYTGQLYLIGNALQPLGMYDDIKSAYFVAKNL